MRITQNNLDCLFSSLVAVARQVIPDASKWVLYKGTAAYSIVTIDPVTGGHSTVVSYVGTTKLEAYEWLNAMRTAYLLVD